MRHLIHLAALALIPAGAVSCRGVLPEAERVPIELSPVAGAEGTKAVAEGGTLPATYILTASAHLSGGGNDTDYFLSHLFAHDGGSWKGAPTVYRPLSGSLEMLCLATEGDGADLKVHSRWSEPDATRMVTVDVPDGTDTGTEILYGAVAIPRGGGATPLAMHHSQALLRFEMTSNAADLVRIDRIEVEDVYPAGTLTVHNYGLLCHEWSFRGRTRQPLVDVPGSAGVTLGDAPEVFDMLLPEQGAGRIRISYRRRDYVTDPWDTAPVVKSVTYAPQVESWWSGRMYDYRLQFTLTEIVMSLNLKAWGSSSASVSTLQ